MRPIGIPAEYFPLLYAVTAGSGLLMALFVAMRCHFNEVIQNHCHAEEFWPSISATIGDQMPERSIWRVFAGISILPRIVCAIMIYRFYKEAMAQPSARNASSAILVKFGPILMCVLEFTKIFSGMGWTFVASFEDLLFHEAIFVLYVVCGFLMQVVQSILSLKITQQPYNTYEVDKATGVCISVSRATNAVTMRTKAARMKVAFLLIQTTAAVNVAYWFWQHNVTCAPGVYSRSTMAEWIFATFNILFDVTQYYDLLGQVVLIGIPAVLPFRSGAQSTSSSSSEDKQKIQAESFKMLNAWSTYPSSMSLYIADFLYGYLYWAFVIHLFQGGYFIPMVAMKFTIEVVAILAPCSQIFLCAQSFRKLVMGGEDGSGTPSARTLSNTTSRIPFIYLISAIFAIFYMDVPHSAENRLVVQGIGAVSLQIGYHARLYSAETLQDKHRLVYATCVGLALNAIGRVWSISIDPFFTGALYNLILGWALIWAAAIIYRQCAFPRVLPKKGSAAVDAAADSDESTHKHQLTSPLYKPFWSSPLSQPAFLGSSAGLCIGVSWGCLKGLALMFVMHHGALARYVGVDPFPSGIFVILSFLVGLYIQHRLRGGSTQKSPMSTASFVRFAVVLMFIGMAVLYYGAIQSNRMYQVSGPEITDESFPLDQVDLKDWRMEEQWGNPWVAFCGGLATIFSIGLLMPMLIELAYPSVMTLPNRGGGDEKAAAGTPTSSDASADTAKMIHPPASIFRAISAYVLRTEVANSLCLCLVLMLNVYVVCFPFVPGGFLMRDRFNVVMGVPAVLIAVTLPIAVKKYLRACNSDKKDNNKENASSHVLPSVGPLTRGTLLPIISLFAFVVIIRVLFQPNVDTSYEPEDVDVLNSYIDTFSDQYYHGPAGKVKGKYERAKKEAYKRIGKITEKQKQMIEDVTPLNALIWTIHFGQDNYGADSFARLLDGVSRSKAAVIGLAESDLSRMMNGYRDVVEYLTYYMGYQYSDYGPTTMDSTFGCALISKYRIVKVNRIIMPSPAGEFSCLIHAWLDVYGETFQVYVGHWGNSEHLPDLKLQAQTLAKVVKENRGNVMFLGYLTNRPEEGHYPKYVDCNGRVRDDPVPIPPGAHDVARGVGAAPEDVVEKTTHTSFTPEERVLKCQGELLDPAYIMYKHMPWKEERYLPKPDEDGEIPPGAKEIVFAPTNYRRNSSWPITRNFHYDHLQTHVLHAHPRFEFEDRYCQYIMFRPENPSPAQEALLAKQQRKKILDNWPAEEIDAHHRHQLELIDWYRVIEDFSEISDTEQQMIEFVWVKKGEKTYCCSEKQEEEEEVKVRSSSSSKKQSNKV